MAQSGVLRSEARRGLLPAQGPGVEEGRRKLGGMEERGHRGKLEAAKL